MPRCSTMHSLKNNPVRLKNRCRRQLWYASHTFDRVDIRSFDQQVHAAKTMVASAQSESFMSASDREVSAQGQNTSVGQQATFVYTTLQRNRKAPLFLHTITAAHTHSQTNVQKQTNKQTNKDEEGKTPTTTPRHTHMEIEMVAEAETYAHKPGSSRFPPWYNGSFPATSSLNLACNLNAASRSSSTYSTPY